MLYSTLQEPLLLNAPSSPEVRLRSWLYAIDVPLLFALQTCTAAVALTHSPQSADGYACGAGALLVLVGLCTMASSRDARAVGAVRACGGAAAIVVAAARLEVPNALAILCVAIVVSFVVRAEPVSYTHLTLPTTPYV